MIELDLHQSPPFVVSGDGSLPSAYAVTELAVASIGAAANAAAELITDTCNGGVPEVVVDRRLASHWFAGSVRPIGWSVPSPWDPLAGDYPTRDGWIKLHTNAPHHRAAALAVLGADADRDAVAAAVIERSGEELEAALVAGGGAAAVLRTPSAWAAHPQGMAVVGEPLLAHEGVAAAPMHRTVDPARPLSGVRVLDLTRVLAGPVATRFLAGLGADVVRIDPPWWSEPAVEPEVTLGKRCATLDLREPDQRAALERLLAGADIVVHGYRSDALERLGLGEERRRALQPGLVDVGLDAYGWTGPWAGRRGFDSLVQMSSGIAWQGRARRGGDAPVPLPVQALDHAAGYLLAAAAITGWRRRLVGNEGSTWRTSLARVATLLTAGPPGDLDAQVTPIDDDDLATETESTDWGPARRLRGPCTIGGMGLSWSRPARRLGADPMPAGW